MRIRGLMVAAALLLASGAPARPPKVGEIAPDFTLTTLDGETVSYGAIKGDVIVLNFWATWCAPCKQEMPLLDAFYRLRKDYGLRIYTVATEDSVSSARLKKILGPYVAMPMIRKLRGPYAVVGGAVPTNFVIDRRGMIVHAQAGALTLDSLNTLLIPLLNAPKPTG